MKRMLALIFAAVTAVGALTACSNAPGESQTPGATTPDEASYYVSGKSTFEIKTDYAVLQYPEKWKDSCKTEIKDGDPYTVSFSAVVKDEQVPVFDIVFGAVPEDGFQVGILPADSGDVDVSVVDYSGSFAEKYPEKDYPELYEMSEDMNDVISGLVYQYNMHVI